MQNVVEEHDTSETEPIGSLLGRRWSQRRPFQHAPGPGVGVNLAARSAPVSLRSPGLAALRRYPDR